MRHHLVALVTFFSFSFVGSAFASGYGSNLPLGGYPLPTCSKPWSKPTKPYFLDEYSVRRYNSEVDTYNTAIDKYNACISEYLAGAEGDLKRIQEEIQWAGRGPSPSSMLRYGYSNLLRGYPSAEEVCQYTRLTKESCVEEYKENAHKDIREILLRVRLL